jgi:hypothetical protein
VSCGKWCEAETQQLTVARAGILSYYRSQEDEGRASRGSINMTVARVLPPGSDKLKFEVSNKLGKSFPSFFLKGNRACLSRDRLCSFP